MLIVIALILAYRNYKDYDTWFSAIVFGVLVILSFILLACYSFGIAFLLRTLPDIINYLNLGGLI